MKFKVTKTHIVEAASKEEALKKVLASHNPKCTPFTKGEVDKLTKAGFLTKQGLSSATKKGSKFPNISKVESNIFIVYFSFSDFKKVASVDVAIKATEK